MLRAIVVGAKVDGFLVDIGKQFMRNLRHPDFGVPHGRGIITIHRTKVTLTIDQHVAQGEILGHTHDSVVHGSIPVRVVFTDDVADDTGRLFIRTIPVVTQLVHGKKHTSVHGLQAITNVW